jgi:hypothetical protein
MNFGLLLFAFKQDREEWISFSFLGKIKKMIFGYLLHF